MRLRFIHFVFPRSRVDANRGLLLGIKNILAEPTHGAQQAPGRMSSTIPAASKFSEEKSYDYGTEAARLLNSKVGGRAVTALAGSRGGMQMAARLLKEQQEDLERLLYKYDHSISVSSIAPRPAPGGAWRRLRPRAAARCSRSGASRRCGCGGRA